MSLRQNQIIRADRLQQLQAPEEAFKNPAQLTFIRTLIDILRRALSELASTREASDQILLQAPNGAVYRITVNNAGALVVANART